MDIQPHCQDNKYMVKLCIAFAKAYGKLPSSGNYTFCPGYPKCGHPEAQLQSAHGAVHQTTVLLDCHAQEGTFVIGKGEAQNSLLGYVCEDYICYPAKMISIGSV